MSSNKFIKTSNIKTIDIVNITNDKNIINNNNNQINISQSSGDNININNILNVNDELTINKYGETTTTNKLSYSYYIICDNENMVKYNVIMNIQLHFITPRSSNPVAVDIKYFIYGHLIYNKKKNYLPYDLYINYARPLDTFQNNQYDAYIFINQIIIPHLYANNNTEYVMNFNWGATALDLYTFEGFHNTYSDEVFNHAINGIIRIVYYNNVYMPTLCNSYNGQYEWQYDSPFYIHLRNTKITI